MNRSHSRMIEALMIGGFVPLSGRELVRLYPTIWSSRQTAERDLIGPSVFGEFVYYTRDEPYAHEIAALVLPGTRREHVERWTGPLRSWCGPEAKTASKGPVERLDKTMPIAGLLPLSGREMHRVFPQVWRNHMTASRDLPVLRALMQTIQPRPEVHVYARDIPNARQHRLASLPGVDKEHAEYHLGPLKYLKNAAM